MDLLLFLDLRPFVEICGRFVEICGRFAHQNLLDFFILARFPLCTCDQSSELVRPLCTKHPPGLIGLLLDVLPWLLSQTWSLGLA